MARYYENSFDPRFVSSTGRLKVSSVTQLCDVKSIGADESILMENVISGGSGTYLDNKTVLSVSANGHYCIKRTKVYYNGFSGKSNYITFCASGLNSQTGVIKRVGYFSSNAVAPYDSAFDGFFIESSNNEIRLKAYRNGTLVLNVDSLSWNGVGTAKSINWENSNLLMVDYSWLEGTICFHVKVNGEYELMHKFDYSSTSSNMMFRSPSQNIRYEIRSTGGTGSLTFVGSQISAEGTLDETGKLRSVNTGTTSISLTTAGTTYPVIAIRKASGFRDRYVKIVDFNAMTNTADQMYITLQLNPVLSNPITYNAVTGSGIESGNGNGSTITVSTPGIILGQVLAGQNAVFPAQLLEDDFLSALGSTILDVSDVLAVCCTIITGVVPVFSSITFKEY